MTEIDDVLASLEFAMERRTYRRLDFYEPYTKQREFHNSLARERLLRAGNQIGKTYAGAAETAYHLTGEYPEWWKGHRFDHPVNGWCAGEGAVLTREGPQTLLCGKPGVEGSLGTGLIPRDRFLDKPSLSRGVTDAFDMIQVQHRTNGVIDGVSTLSFKSYDQGRAKFQTATLDFVWCDEEPPEDIYTECLARIASKTDGFVFITFTPLKGMSTVVMKFLQESSLHRSDTVMTVWDVPGQTREHVDQMMAGYPKWQHNARMMGVPMQGSGQVFPYDPESITENPLVFVPHEWTKLWGIDFGIGHPFGAVLTFWDREQDIIHVHAAIRMADSLPLQHASAMRTIAGSTRIAWPIDGTHRRDDGLPMSRQYTVQGLRMLPTHATFPDGSISTEAGIIEMCDRMTTNRFKVARTLMQGPWGDEWRMYHRDEEGQIVKKGDDLMSATRIAIMAKRHGQPGPFGGEFGRGRRADIPQAVADGIDFPLF
jgi:phage terminase large subunit-like protein